MKTLVTSGIQISVESFFQPGQSHPDQMHYFFAYRITIKNNSDATVQLKRRHWYIFDSNGKKSEVEGEGVIGETPILSPGEEFQYVSGCNLTTDIGRMFGTYQMERIFDGQTFFVKIPVFHLIAPFRNN